MKQFQKIEKVGGFSLLEMLGVISIIAVLLAAFLPSLMKARTRASRINCINNLKQVGLAFRIWELDHNDKYPDQVSVTNGGMMELVGTGRAYVHFLVVSNELNTPNLLLCPTDTNRFAAMDWNALRNRNLSYFVGLDATDAQPQAIISGDDNFTINGVKTKSGLVSYWTNATLAWMATRHMHQGNIGLADGSVQSLTSTRLNQAWIGTGVATNRFFLP